MPESLPTHAAVWKKRREVKIGRPTQSRLPLAVAISSDDSDISETSNSLEVQLSPEDLGWMRRGAGELDPVWPD
jgi:hypothetical protein